MLILTRKVGEKITIGDDIEITVVEIKGKQVRLGINAPSELPVHREEVYRRILEENLKAASYLEGPNEIEEIEGIIKKKE